MAGVPHPVLDGGVPHPALGGGGTPSSPWWGVPPCTDLGPDLDGYSLSRPGKGISPIQTWDGLPPPSSGPGKGVPLPVQTWEGITPPPLSRPGNGVQVLTDTCENITSHHPSDADGKNNNTKKQESLARTQEAYCLSRSKYTLCFSGWRYSLPPPPPPPDLRPGWKGTPIPGQDRGFCRA